MTKKQAFNPFLPLDTYIPDTKDPVMLEGVQALYFTYVGEGYMDFSCIYLL